MDCDNQRIARDAIFLLFQCYTGWLINQSSHCLLVTKVSSSIFAKVIGFILSSYLCVQGNPHRLLSRYFAFPTVWRIIRDDLRVTAEHKKVDCGRRRCSCSCGFASAESGFAVSPSPLHFKKSLLLFLCFTQKHI